MPELKLEQFINYIFNKVNLLEDYLSKHKILKIMSTPTFFHTVIILSIIVITATPPDTKPEDSKFFIYLYTSFLLFILLSSFTFEKSIILTNLKNIKNLPLKIYGKIFKISNKETIIKLLDEDGVHSKNIHNFKLASDEIKKDRAFILEFILKNKEYTNILEYAPRELVSNKEFMLEAVKLNTTAFLFASDELKDNEELFIEALQFLKNQEEIYVFYHYGKGSCMCVNEYFLKTLLENASKRIQDEVGDIEPLTYFESKKFKEQLEKELTEKPKAPTRKKVFKI